MRFFRRRAADQDGRKSLHALLVSVVEPLFLRLRPQVLERLSALVVSAVAASRSGAGFAAAYSRRWREIDVLVARLHELRRVQEGTRRDLRELAARMEQTDGERERRFLLRRFVQRHRASDPVLRDDPLAVRRGFDLEALREQLRLGWDRIDAEQEAALAGIGAAMVDEVQHALGTGVATDQYVQALLAGGAIATLERFVAPDHYWRLRVAALRALGRLAESLPQERWAALFPASSLALIYRQCYRDDDNVWVQIEALRALAACDRERWLATCADRLADGILRQDDDLFVRHAICADLGATIVAAEQGRAAVLLAGCLQPGDISDYVRLGAVQALARLPLPLGRVHVQRALGLYPEVKADQCPQVRAGAVLGLLQRIRNCQAKDSEAALLRNLLRQVLATERHELPLRSLLGALPAALLASPTEAALPWQPDEMVQPFIEAIDRLSTDTGLSLALRRMAQEVREELLVCGMPGLAAAVAELHRILHAVPEGGRIRWTLPDAIPDADTAGRVLAQVSRLGFGLYASLKGRTLRIQKGDRFATQLWRFWHELRRPGPDKRSGFFHSVGRCLVGGIRAHPLLLGEESPTKVPGEPLFKDDEGQWRRYLPLLDDFLSLVTWGPGTLETRCHSAQGVTVVRAPTGWWARRRAWWTIVRSYAALAKLRNQGLGDLADNEPVHNFLAALRGLGFVVEFHPHGWLDQRRYWHPLADPTLSRQFGAAIVDVPARSAGLAPELEKVGVTRVTSLDPAAVAVAESPQAAAADQPTGRISRRLLADRAGLRSRSRAAVAAGQVPAEAGTPVATEDPPTDRYAAEDLAQIAEASLDRLRRRSHAQQRSAPRPSGDDGDA